MRRSWKTKSTSCTKFQSTHSLRSATQQAGGFDAGSQVSIHALLAECDCLPPHLRSVKSLFQSTHSLRSATAGKPVRAANSEVSIHALLAECDSKSMKPIKSSSCFNPRTPCGVRLNNFHLSFRGVRFQSTHSLRSATRQHGQPQKMDLVSIHALLAECDVRIERRIGPSRVSIHALLAECDLSIGVPFRWWAIVSIHALLAECDRQHLRVRQARFCFNPRTPCGVRPLSPQGRAKRPRGFNPRTPCGVRQGGQAPGTLN